MTEERESGSLERSLHRLEDMAVGLSGRTGAVMTDRAEDFVHSAAVGDMFEIEASMLALQRSQSENIRDFARQMIDDHSASSDNPALRHFAAEVAPTIEAHLEHVKALAA